MHRIAPEKLDLSIAAMCMIGLLKQIELRMGMAASDIVWQHPPIESDVIAAICYTRLEEYSQFVGLFFEEKYPHPPFRSARRAEFQLSSVLPVRLVSKK